MDRIFERDLQILKLKIESLEKEIRDLVSDNSIYAHRKDGMESKSIPLYKVVASILDHLGIELVYDPFELRPV